jgi:hypothetical protein
MFLFLQSFKLKLKAVKIVEWDKTSFIFIDHDCFVMICYLSANYNITNQDDGIIRVNIFC